MAANLSLVLALVGFALALYAISRIGRRPKDYPPGPPTVPVLGNLLQFEKWSKIYGPIYSLIIGSGKVMIILSSNREVKELLDKRAQATNDRSDRYIGHQILSNGERILLQVSLLSPLRCPYGKVWQKQRKMYHKLLSISLTQSYLPYIELENKQMNFDILTNPDHFLRHTKRYTNSTTMMMTYGRRTPQYDDAEMREYLEILEKTTGIIQSTAANVPDAYPIFRKLPRWLLPGVKMAVEHTKREEAFYLRLWNEVKLKLDEGTQKPCFTVQMLREQEKEGFDDRFGAYISGGSLEAGTDTTSNTILAFIQAMLLFPDVQEKAHAEIDRVLGDRLPSMSDWANLPYVRGCVKETLRWSPTTTLIVPHATFSDEIYNGYRIPRAAEIVVNAWAVNNNPNIYDDPRRFDPARFINDAQSSFEASQNPDVTKRDHFTFGAGRRICAGIHLADVTTFLAVSRLLWGFDITPAPGQTSLPDPLLRTAGLVSMPLPFPARFEPRSPAKADKIKQMWNEARQLLDSEMQWREIPETLKFHL
ncbi:putative Cytochrome P450 oxidoreductase [Fonsecaea pedrosoi]|nr:putative Cytochrome P450 oxidoreductase [Fonsecaea pedrosoi]